MERRFQRSRSGAVLGGVCSGLGRYLDLDPSLIRIFFVFLALGNGGGVFFYLLLWILMPAEGAPSEELGDRARRFGSELAEVVRRPEPRRGVYLGAALVILGSVWLIQNLNVPWLAWLRFDVLWPVLLIVGGVVLILRRARGASDEG